MPFRPFDAFRKSLPQNAETRTGGPQFMKVNVSEAQDHRGVPEDTFVSFDRQRKTLVGAETGDLHERKKIEQVGMNFVGIEPAAGNTEVLTYLSKIQMGIEYMNNGQIQINKIGANEIALSYGQSWSSTLDEKELKVGEQIILTSKSPSQTVDPTNLQIIMQGSEKYFVVMQFTQNNRAAVFLRKR